MAFDCFMKIDQMDGESTDAQFKTWQQLESFSCGVSQPGSGSQSTGGSRNVARANHHNFHVVKDMDKATPKLVQFCCDGQHIKKIQVTLCRAVDKKKQKYLEFTLSDVIVTGVTPLGSMGGDALPKESVSFDYGKFEINYTQLDHATGKPVGNVKAGWDRIQNKFIA